MKLIKGDFKERQKKDLYDMLSELPNPPSHANLTDDQLVWWRWMGKILVQTGKFAELDLIHLQNAAVQLDLRNKIIKTINKRNAESKDGVGGVVMVYSTGARQIDPLITAQNQNGAQRGPGMASSTGQAVSQ